MMIQHPSTWHILQPVDTHVELAKVMVEIIYIRNQQGERYLTQLLNLKEAEIGICGKQNLMISLCSEK
jgi:hypothetical protein